MDVPEKRAQNLVGVVCQANQTTNSTRHCLDAQKEIQICFSLGGSAPIPPGIVGLQPPRFICYLVYKSTNRGGRRPTDWKGLGGGAPSEKKSLKVHPSNGRSTCRVVCLRHVQEIELVVPYEITWCPLIIIQYPPPLHRPIIGNICDATGPCLLEMLMFPGRHFSQAVVELNVPFCLFIVIHIHCMNRGVEGLGVKASARARRIRSNTDFYICSRPSVRKTYPQQIKTSLKYLNDFHEHTSCDPRHESPPRREICVSFGIRIAAEAGLSHVMALRPDTH